MSIAVIIINWNRWALTRQCVERVQAGSPAETHIYVVDNASTDGSLEQLESLSGQVTVIPNEVNAGWAGGNNVGLRRALADGREFMLLLNNDALIEPDALRLLVELHESVAQGGGPLPVLGAVERRSDGSYGFVRAEVNPGTGIPGWTWGSVPAPVGQALAPSPYVHGAALFAHRTLFESVGLFDERFFLCFDETDWCYRARLEGHPMLVARDVVITHDGSATMGGYKSPLTTYFMARNRLLFSELYCTPSQQSTLRRLYADWFLEIAEKDGRLAAAFRRGVMDYRARRFGDCPDMIRTLGTKRRAGEPDT